MLRVLSTVTTIRLPRTVRLDMMEGLGSSGWCWDAAAGSKAVRVACTTPPVEYVEPVAVAMLGAWARYQRGRGCEVVIDDSLRSPTSFRSGLLSAIAGRSSGGSEGREFIWLPRDSDPESALIELVDRVVRPPYQAAEQIARYCLSEFARNVFDHAQTGNQGHSARFRFTRQASGYALLSRTVEGGFPRPSNPITREISTTTSR